MPEYKRNVIQYFMNRMTKPRHEVLADMHVQRKYSKRGEPKTGTTLVRFWDYFQAAREDLRWARALDDRNSFTGAAYDKQWLGESPFPHTVDFSPEVEE